MPDHRDDTDCKRAGCQHKNGDRRVPVIWIHLIHHPLLLRRCGKVRRHFGMLLQIGFGSPKLLQRLFRLRRKRLQIARLFLRPLLRKPSLALPAHSRDPGTSLFKLDDEFIHLLLVFEITLLLRSVPELDHQIGN